MLQPDNQTLKIMNSLLGNRKKWPLWKLETGHFRLCSLPEPCVEFSGRQREPAGRAHCVGTVCSLLDNWVPARWRRTGASSGRSEPNDEGERGLIYRERLKQPHTSELSSAGDEPGSDALGTPRTFERCKHQREELAQCERLLTASSGMILTPEKCRWPVRAGWVTPVLESHLLSWLYQT